MGANRLPIKQTDFCDAPVSSSFSKRLWWRYSHSPYRTILPPRLLVVLLLSAQIMFLAAVKFGPGVSAWTSLSSFESVVVGREVIIRHPFKFLPHERQESPQYSDVEGASLLSQSQRESAVVLNDLPSLTSTFTAPSTPANLDKDAPIDVFNAVSMSMSSDAVKGKQELIAEKVYGSVSRDGEGETSVQQAARDNAVILEGSLNKETGIVTPLEKGSPLGVKDEQAKKGQEERVISAPDDTYSVRLAPHTNMKRAREVKEGDSSSQCRYGYIYVYDLPGEFNLDIIANCTLYNIFLGVCETLLNGGLGNMLGESSPLRQTGSWFVSDQFTAEVVFHNRILQHPCLTDNPEAALGFYVPYYAGLDVGRFLWGGFSAERRDHISNSLLQWLSEQQAWKKNGGWGHFLMIGRITWDFRRSKDEDWGSGFFYRPSMKNMTRLLIEKNPWDYMEMAVPYPTNFHPQSDADLMAWQNHIRSLKRSNLFSFAGAPRRTFPNDFRGILLQQCQQSHRCQSLDCSNGTCDNNENSLKLFMNSTFCLQPRGDSFTRRSTFDCLLAGSIPVFFWHRSAYMQYKWHLPEDVGSYSVFVSKDDMRNGTRIEDVLNSYSVEKVEAMREAVVEIIPRIVYAVSGFSLKEHEDAFDVAIEGVMKRFQELNFRAQWR